MQGVSYWHEASYSPQGRHCGPQGQHLESQGVMDWRIDEVVGAANDDKQAAVYQQQGVPASYLTTKALGVIVGQWQRMERRVLDMS